MNSSQHWTQYWEQGSTTSFGDTFKDGYDGVLEAEWREVFTALKPKDCVLDLCTGNASLIRMADKLLSHFNEINFTGVDYADVVKDDYQNGKTTLYKWKFEICRS